jgi:hypothetical protein
MRIPSHLTVAATLSLAFMLGGCGKPDTVAVPPAEATTTPTKPSAPPLTGFAKDLQYVKDGGYTYIWVFSRRDGKPFDKDDSAFLRGNAPQVVDWVTTDEGKKVIAGTNFNLEEGNLGLLKKRFVAEDYSAK